MKTTMQAALPMNAMNTMELTDAAPRRTMRERLAVWAAELMQTARADVRRYEAAVAALGTGTNPLEDAHDADRALRAMLYGKYFADSVEMK
ncbi:hypothetical protein [Selenomonas sp.]|uniref:hypothetical protein n=1 Tax=Selenomonas sp. TaxID=2053611 RepID=UPI0025F65149|nr:hypothetical protein [Selenomonas sp.]MCI6282994.1 hypothetical protein [Selenomonas sp.]